MPLGTYHMGRSGPRVTGSARTKNGPRTRSTKDSFAPSESAAILTDLARPRPAIVRAGKTITSDDRHCYPTDEQIGPNSSQIVLIFCRNTVQRYGSVLAMHHRWGMGLFNEQVPFLTTELLEGGYYET
jgi:hypothetical protein